MSGRIATIIATWMLIPLTNGVDLSNCNATFIQRSELYDCNTRGALHKPSAIDSITADSIESCVLSCKKKADCKSVRYIQDSHRCVRYNKYLGDMGLDRQNFQKGNFTDKECLTTNCETQAACSAVKDCHDVDFFAYTGLFYSFYACGYGVTARPLHFVSNIKYHSADHDACGIVNLCTRSDYTGTVDIHWIIPEKRWACVTYEDNPDADARAYYGVDWSLKDNHVGRNRFSLKNESVGASYGYYLESYEYYD